MLAVDSLWAGYGHLTVLRDVTIALSPAEIVAIVGSNGAGKSTLLRSISGLIRKQRGTVRFDGADVARLASHQIVDLGVVQVPEARQLFPEMTVADNLVLGSYATKARKERDQRLERVYGLFPVLEKRKKQLAGSLSGGEQQMLAIGRGVMARPRVLMLDEPSLGLAPLIIENILETVRTIASEGVGVLMVEQNVEESLHLCDRGYVLENGTIVLQGVRSELLNNEQVKTAYLGL